MRKKDKYMSKFYGLYHKVCALFVSAEKRVGFSCNSISMPPTGYMLNSKILISTTVIVKTTLIETKVYVVQT